MPVPAPQAACCCACRWKWRRCSATGSIPIIPIAPHVMSTIQQLRGGRTTTASSARACVADVYAELLSNRFKLARKRLGFNAQNSIIETGLQPVPKPLPPRRIAAGQSVLGRWTAARLTGNNLRLAGWPASQGGMQMDDLRSATVRCRSLDDESVRP